MLLTWRGVSRRPYRLVSLCEPRRIPSSWTRLGRCQQELPPNKFREFQSGRELGLQERTADKVP